MPRKATSYHTWNQVSSGIPPTKCRACGELHSYGQAWKRPSGNWTCNHERPEPKKKAKKKRKKIKAPKNARSLL